MRNLLALATLMISFCGSTYAQTGEMAFEVAAVKPSAPETPGQSSSWMSINLNRVKFTNVSLLQTTLRAFKLKRTQLVCPDWLSSAHFDINAKVPDGHGEKDVPEMLQALLLERFHLKFHKEERTSGVYALVPVKGEIKLEKAEDPNENTNVNGGNKVTKLSGTISMATLADTLSDYVDRPVLDFTGSNEVYKIALEWTNLTDTDGTDLFGALQRVGLKLEARKAPLMHIVIDSIDKTPTEN